MLNTDERLASHDVTLAVHSEQIGALLKANESVVASMARLNATMMTSAISVTVALIGAIVAVLLK